MISQPSIVTVGWHFMVGISGAKRVYDDMVHLSRDFMGLCNNK